MSVLTVSDSCCCKCCKCNGVLFQCQCWPYQKAVNVGRVVNVVSVMVYYFSVNVDRISIAAVVNVVSVMVYYFSVNVDRIR